MSSDKGQQYDETRSFIESRFLFFSECRRKDMLVLEHRFSSRIAKFFGYELIALTKGFDYTYTKKVNKTYAVETTYTAEAQINSLGNLEIDTYAQDKYYDKPEDVECEGESVATVYKWVKFVNEDAATIRRYEDELVQEKNFKHFMNSLQVAKKPNIFLYLLNFLFDYSTTILLLFLILATIVFPIVLYVANDLLKFQISLPLVNIDLGFHSPLPVVIFLLFTACLILNKLIKNKLNMDEGYGNTVFVIIAAVMFVLSGYYTYFYSSDGAFSSYLDNHTGLAYLTYIVYIVFAITEVAVFGRYAFFSIFRTRYFVALYKYLAYKRGTKKVSSGAYSDMKTKYDKIMSSTVQSLNGSHFSALTETGIHVH